LPTARRSCSPVTQKTARASIELEVRRTHKWAALESPGAKRNELICDLHEGWAIQGYGSLLIKSIKGDYGNVKGFPAHAFYAFLQRLIDDEEYPGDE
jgi:hypothetical protein